jgi:ATP-dependent DNA helicase Q4
MKDGSYVFEVPRIANDMRITMNEVFDRLQKLKVCLDEPSKFPS